MSPLMPAPRCCRSCCGCRRPFRSAVRLFARPRMGGRGGDVIDALARRLALDLGPSARPSRRDPVRAAFRAADAADWPALFEINELAVALAVSAERRLETTAQGAAFVVAARAAWDCEPLRELAGRGVVAYPVAVAAAAAGHGLPLETSLEAFGWPSFPTSSRPSCGWARSARRPGRRFCRAPAARSDARPRGRPPALDDLGSAAFRSDIAAMRHETQYSRLFRS